jgi:TonB family protein
MILFGLRLLVALVTFVGGVAAARLLDFKSAPASAERGVMTVSVLVSDAPRSCPLDSGRVVYGGVLQMKRIDKLSPAYPHYGKVARVSGSVAVKVEVNEDGMVTKAKAITGYGMLPEAAVKDALNTRFEPMRISGQPVRVSGEIMYDFVLD